MGKLDILVANAGITRDNLFVQLSDEAWDEVIAVNLTATFRLARAAIKGMMRRRTGRIIGITSVVGVTGNAGQGNYAATKAGMIGMIKSIAQEYAKRGVTANCIAPGFIATPMTDKLNEKQREAILTRVPAGRLGEGADDRRRGGLSRVRRGRLCDRPDAACKRRNGDDLKAVGRVNGRAGQARGSMVTGPPVGWGTLTGPDKAFARSARDRNVVFHCRPGRLFAMALKESPGSGVDQTSQSKWTRGLSDE